MASRGTKPPISGRPRTQQQPGPSSRPPSALGNRATASNDDNTLSTPTKSQASFTPAARTDSECNIQVVIRCRRRSSKEISDGSPIVVSANGPKSQEIVVQTEPQTSALGMVQLPPTRTYPFDTVFGPEADQSLIYQDVVAPMLDEVINGYNCTIFAYGQTGTGKTYTMHGDLTPTPLGLPSPSAGMIPRALHKLFTQLNERFSDFSVKVSYIELYNEELRDLLSSDLPAPSGTIQPMAAGKGKARDRDTEELRIWDDAKRGGVTISGLKEVFVKDAADAIAVLSKGTERRQVAATRFNDHSSRSHTIFTLQVHTKETSGTDEFVRSGKLNLVDLAGAENIGRSGAQNARAREAGAINQSLLTLGRVITSLVEKAAHVPYRESKLTRLLQDSLGGRTKTCIIATVSPARCNIEETLSTLDYAINARSIRNRPEINQRMTKNALMKECVEEIERLRSNLLAAREKNGIFFAEDTWNKMVIDREKLESDLKDTRTALAAADSELRGSRADLDEALSQLAHRNQELAQMRDTLHVTRDKLSTTEKRLDKTRSALEDEIIVRGAHQETEGSLDKIATELRTTVEQTISDNTVLHGKLEHKAALLNANLKLATRSRTSLGEHVSRVQSLVDGFSKAHGVALDNLAVTATELRNKQIEQLSNLSASLKEQLGALKETSKTLHAAEKTDEQTTAELKTCIDSSSQQILQSFDSWSSSFLQTTVSLIQEIKVAGKASCNVAENSLDVLYQAVEAMATDAQLHLANEARVIAEVKASTDSAVADEIRRLKEQNTSLAQMLEREQIESERARGDLVRRVSGMLEDYTRARDTNLRKAFSAMEEATVTSEQQWEQLGQEHGAKLDAHVEEGKGTAALIQRRRQDGKRKREDGAKAISSIAHSFEQGLASVQASTSSSFAAQGTEVQDMFKRARASYDDTFERMDRVKRARIDTTTTSLHTIQQTYRSTRETAASSAKQIGQDVSNLLSNTDLAEKATATHHSDIKAEASAIQAVGRSLEEDWEQDGPSSSAPRRQTYSYTQSWQLTADRDVLLQHRPRSALSAISDHTLVTELGPNDIQPVEASCSRIPSPLPDSAVDLKPANDYAVPHRPVTAAAENDVVFAPVAKQARTSKTLAPLAEKPSNLAGARGLRRR